MQVPDAWLDGEQYVMRCSGKAEASEAVDSAPAPPEVPVKKADLRLEEVREGDYLRRRVQELGFVRDPDSRACLAVDSPCKRVTFWFRDRRERPDETYCLYRRDPADGLHEAGVRGLLSDEQVRQLAHLAQSARSNAAFVESVLAWAEPVGESKPRRRVKA